MAKSAFLKRPVDVVAARKQANSYAGGDDDLMFADANWLSDCGQEFLTDLRGILVGAKIRKQHHELVPAHSADGV